MLGFNEMLLTVILFGGLLCIVARFLGASNRERLESWILKNEGILCSWIGVILLILLSLLLLSNILTKETHPELLIVAAGAVALIFMGKRLRQKGGK